MVPKRKNHFCKFLQLFITHKLRRYRTIFNSIGTKNIHKFKGNIKFLQILKILATICNLCEKMPKQCDFCNTFANYLAQQLSVLIYMIAQLISTVNI